MLQGHPREAQEATRETHLEQLGVRLAGEFAQPPSLTRRGGEVTAPRGPRYPRQETHGPCGGPAGNGGALAVAFSRIPATSLMSEPVFCAVALTWR